MPYVLTTGSSVSCDHPPTGGGALTLAVAATGVLKVEGRTVPSGTLAGATIASGCAQRGPNENPCLTASTQSPGSMSQVLRVDGLPVLLETASGSTPGVPGNTWSAKAAGQSVLKAD
jgi:hypothetical protein